MEKMQEQLEEAGKRLYTRFLKTCPKNQNKQQRICALELAHDECRKIFKTLKYEIICRMGVQKAYNKKV